MALKGRHDKGLGKLDRRFRGRFTMFAALLVIAGCSSSGSDDGGSSPPPPPPPPPPPAAPVANAGPDRTVQEQTSITLAGSATDVNGDPVTFAWIQTAGTMVTLNGADTATPDFMSPDVTLGNPETLTFELTASDPGGLSTTDEVDITVQEAAVPVTVSGVLQYEFPPPNNQCRGLNFDAIELRPIRQATVQLLNSAGTTLIDTTVSNDLGQYAFTMDPQTDFIVRVRAELKRSSTLTWDVEVRNNVDTSGSPPPLAQRPIYVMDSAVTNSGTADQTLNLTATTGWGGSSYTDPRVAAPFSILDAIYSAMLFIAAEDPNVTFSALDAFWSVDNKATSPTDIDAGDLPTSFYNGQSQLFLLGMDGDDTEEFDDHVITHEWTHYFEDNLSRSDSIGGPHFIGSDSLDMRVSFGEGFANAMSAMTLGNPIYCDTGWFGNQQSGFGVNMEEQSTNAPGWFDEVSVFEIVYDLWDTNNEGGASGDTGSIGFGPIYDVMTGPQSTTPAFTSIFSFITYLKQQGTGQDAFIDALLAAQNIDGQNIDIYGDNESNDRGGADDVLPVYTDIAQGQTVNVCVNSQFDDDRDGNKLSEHRYLRFDAPSSRNYSLLMTATSADGGAPSQPSNGFDCSADPNDPENHEHSDPDFLVWQNGTFRGWGVDCDPNSESESIFMSSGINVIDIQDWRHEDDDARVDYPEQVCFDFTIN